MGKTEMFPEISEATFPEKLNLAIFLKFPETPEIFRKFPRFIESSENLLLISQDSVFHLPSWILIYLKNTFSFKWRINWAIS